MEIKDKTNQIQILLEDAAEIRALFYILNCESKCSLDEYVEGNSLAGQVLYFKEDFLKKLLVAVKPTKDEIKFLNLLQRKIKENLKDFEEVK